MSKTLNQSNLRVSYRARPMRKPSSATQKTKKETVKEHKKYLPTIRRFIWRLITQRFVFASSLLL